MEWRAEYSVGIEEIDKQHQELLRLFSCVEEAVVRNQGWSAIHYSLVEVRQFTEFHFKFEEALMRLYGYPGSAEHAEAHRQILGDVVDIEQASVRTDAKEGLLAFYRHWLITHIQDADRAYAEHIVNGGKVVVPIEFQPNLDTGTKSKQVSILVATAMPS